MSNPQLLYDVARMRQREQRRAAVNSRLASAARPSGSRPEVRILLSLADGLIALGLRLRRRYQPGESLALVPLGRLAEDAGVYASGIGSQPRTVLPVLAFQVIQWLPQRTTSLTYWSLLPSVPSTNGAPDAPGGRGLLCMARPLK